VESVRVGRLDAEFAGARVWVIVGPTPWSDARVYLPVLEKVARNTVDNRLGLRPRPGTRMWDYRTDFGDQNLIDSSGLDADDLEATMNHLVGLPSREPILVGNAGGYVLLGIDHGLGDAHVIIELVAALTKAGEAELGAFHPPAPPRHFVANPLEIVARTVLSGGVANVIRDVRRERQMRRMRRSSEAQSANPATEGSPAPATATQYATVFVRSEPDFMKQLRVVRDDLYGSASVSAVLFYGLRKAFSDVGVNLADTTGVLTDLRRFLGPDQATFANLSTPVAVPSPPGQTAEEFAGELTEALKSTYPVTRTLAAAALLPIRRRLASRHSSADAPADRTLMVTISDISKIKALQTFSYRPDGGYPVHVVALPPGGKDQITVATSRIGGEVQATATFYPDMVSAEHVRESLRRALTLDTYR
jgi:hypothetical protein